MMALPAAWARVMHACCVHVKQICQALLASTYHSKLISHPEFHDTLRCIIWAHAFSSVTALTSTKAVQHALTIFWGPAQQHNSSYYTFLALTSAWLGGICTSSRGLLPVIPHRVLSLLLEKKPRFLVTLPPQRRHRVVRIDCIVSGLWKGSQGSPCYEVTLVPIGLGQEQQQQKAPCPLESISPCLHVNVSGRISLQIQIVGVFGVFWCVWCLLFCCSYTHAGALVSRSSLWCASQLIAFCIVDCSFMQIFSPPGCCRHDGAGD